MFLKNTLWIYWLRDLFFTKKSKLIFDFCHIWRSFCRRKTCYRYLQVSRASFGRINKPIQFFHFVINGFHVFGNKFFSKKKLVLHNFAFFSFLSSCCLFSLMSGQIIHYWCSTKVQSNIFWGPKYGFTASKAFYGKFSLDFLFVVCLLFFL